jgi:hypothetical protein
MGDDLSRCVDRIVVLINPSTILVYLSTSDRLIEYATKCCQKSTCPWVKKKMTNRLNVLRFRLEKYRSIYLSSNYYIYIRHYIYFSSFLKVIDYKTLKYETYVLQTLVQITSMYAYNQILCLYVNNVTDKNFFFLSMWILLYFEALYFLRMMLYYSFISFCLV